MLKKIAIFGGGVGGLTVAHELSKFDDYKINIYEKKVEIGGVARSGRDKDGCATEYCWRVFFGFYGNLLKILKEIPLIEDSSKNVLENLTLYNNINITDRSTKLKDKLVVAYKVLYGFTSCDDRLDKLDNLTWWEGLGTLGSSNLYREIGAWLGMDRLKGSFKSVLKVGMEMHFLTSIFTKNYKDFITSKPTSEAWFIHWQKYLLSKNVKISFEQEISKLNIENNKIVSAEVVDLQTKKISTIVADKYILSIPVEALTKLVLKTPELQQGSLKDIKKLRDKCLHIQLSFQLYFDRKISLGQANSFLLIDSAWDLIVLSYDQAFMDTQLSNNLANIKGGWSVAACTAYTPGIVFGKPMNKCSEEEIKAELWAQINQSKNLKKIISENNKFDLSKEMIVKWSPMWPTYSINSHGELTTTEPKFTNNAGSWAIRPSYKTQIDNLYIATAYVKETIDVFSMEAAAFAGKSVAKEIDYKSTDVYVKQRPTIFWPFRKIDEILFKYNLPNIGLVTILALCGLIIVLPVFWITLQLSFRR